MLNRFGAERIFAGLVACQVATAGGAFLTNILIARTLGPDARGQVAILLQLVYASTALASLGRPQALLARVSSPNGVTRTALALLPICLAVGFSISFVLSVSLSVAVDPIELFLAVSSQVVGGIIFAFVRALAIVRKELLAHVVNVAGSQGVFLGGGIWLLWSGSGSVSVWLLVYSLGSLMPALVGLLIGVMRTSKGHRNGAPASKQIATFGFRIFPGYLFEHIAGRLDRLLLPVFASYAQLGLYTVVVACFEVVIWPIKQFADSRVGTWAVRSREKSLRLARVMVQCALAGGILSMVSAAALYLLLVPVFGAPYEPAKDLIWLVGLSTYLRCQCLILNALGLASQTPKVGNAMNIWATIAAGLGYIFLMPMFGAAGAAIASAGGSLVGLSIGLLVWRSVSRRSVSL